MESATNNIGYSTVWNIGTSALYQFENATEIHSVLISFTRSVAWCQYFGTHRRYGRYARLRCCRVRLASREPYANHG